MRGIIHIMILGTLNEVCKGQFMAIDPQISGRAASSCENPGSTASVERFFDLVFTEFHSTPPACVCIQMCPGQATYCYPNGCLRRAEKKKVEETTLLVNAAPIVNFEATTKSALFKSNYRDIVDDILDRPDLYSPHNEIKEKTVHNDLFRRPNSLKELVHKYKKPPKLEVRYNLREQVKNTKSEKLNREKNIDISKTRWPLNKNLQHGKTLFHKVRNYKKNYGTQQSKFFGSTFPNYDPFNYIPVNNKKSMSKRENSEGVNNDAAYLYQLDTNNFTLQALIDDLFENDISSTKKDTWVSFNIEVKDIPTNQQAINGNLSFTDLKLILDEESDNKYFTNNTSVSIILINSTEDLKNVNKYHVTNTTNQATISNMIANMNEEIEKQNYASFEFMERVTGAKIIFSEISTTDKVTENDVPTTTLFTTEEIPETAKDTKIIDTGPTTENQNVPENLTTAFEENIKYTLKPASVIISSYKKRQQRKILKRKNLH